MPRKATGQLIWRPTGYFGRFPVTVDGQRKHVFKSLETKNPELAARRLAELVAEAQGTGRSTVGETFEQAAERVHLLRAGKIAGARNEIGFLRNHAFSIIGHMPVTEISKADVMTVLERVRDSVSPQTDRPYSDQTILHIRNAMAAVFKQLRREKVVHVLPVPAGDEELPECQPDAVDDRPKAVLSDEELLVYLAYTDARKSEAHRGAVRERQMLALLSRCVGGMRTGELHGLTWARAAMDGRRFDALEVIRYKTRRKAARRGSKALVRQLYPLGETVLPFFLRYWWVRTSTTRKAEPAPDSVLFPVRRPKTMESDRTGERRGKTTWARALRRDVERAFHAAHKAGVSGVPAPDSRRWLELFEGTDDRKPLWFHNSRNMAAIVAERAERLKAAARFTGHASGSMLQHYREMAGEVDVVPVLAELLPDANALLTVLRGWCQAEEIDEALVFGTPETPPNDQNGGPDESALRKRTEGEKGQKTALGAPHSEPQTLEIIAPETMVLGLGAGCRRFESVHPDQNTHDSAALQHDESADSPAPVDKRTPNTHCTRATRQNGESSVATLPAGRATAMDMLRAAARADLEGDKHGSRRLLAEALELAKAHELAEGEGDKARGRRR